MASQPSKIEKIRIISKNAENNQVKSKINDSYLVSYPKSKLICNIVCYNILLCF